MSVVAHLDRETESMTLIQPTGESLVAPWPRDRLEATSAISSMTYLLGGDRLLFRTNQGDSIVAELPAYDLQPVRGRPVVYLDQNHWNTLSNRLHDPGRVPAAERAAAEWLIEVVRAREVLLPMSAGHMAETCQWSDDARRYHLALTILRLSAGWKLRDPLTLRITELQRALLGSVGQTVLPEVAPVTLAPGALFEELAGPAADHAEWPPEIALALRALTDVSTIFDVMLDGEAVSQLEIPGWRQHFQEFTDWLGQQRPNLRRGRTRAKFLSDIQHEMASAAHRGGLTPGDCSAWFRAATDDVIARLPSLALYREVLHERLSNPGSVWEQNDLTDMMYLTCGAAYCDYTVAERSHAAHLHRAIARLGRTDNVFRRLADLKSSLETALASQGPEQDS